MKQSSVDFVLAAAAKELQKKPHKSWFSKLPSEAQQRLSEIKEAFNAGRFAALPHSVVCTAVESLLKEQKWPVPASKDTILRWLRSSST